VELSSVQLRDAAYYESLQITFKLSTTVTNIETATKIVKTQSNESYNYEYLVLATGADARRPSIPGNTLNNVFVMRTLSDSNMIGKTLSSYESTNTKPNVVVVGSSFIGMEAAAVLSKSCNVTVVGSGKFPYYRVLGDKIGEALGNLATSHGVVLKMDSAAAEFRPAPSDSSRVGSVVLKGGEVLPADFVVLGVGCIPSTDYLKDSGIALDKDGGITVSAQLQLPNADGVFAIGN
jgi:apoptosis-inducing factor 3